MDTPAAAPAPALQSTSSVSNNESFISKYKWYLVVALVVVIVVVVLLVWYFMSEDDKKSEPAPAPAAATAPPARSVYRPLSRGYRVNPTNYYYDAAFRERNRNTTNF